MLREDIKLVQLSEISEKWEPEARADADVVTRMLNDAEETFFSLRKMNDRLNKNILSR